MSSSVTDLEGQPSTPSLSPAVAAAVTIMNQPFTAMAPARLARGVQAVAPHLTADQAVAWAQALAVPMQKASVTTPNRIGALLGQCAVESEGFRALEEDLNYSAARLCVVWPNRFPNEAAASPCARAPEQLANTVYADRLGNGNAASGDGWRFRGRGLIQITGRDNYQRFADAMGMTIDAAADHAGTQQGAADSAVWFWSTHRLNVFADSWMLEKITISINGGTEGAADRVRMCNLARQAIGA